MQQQLIEIVREPVNPLNKVKDVKEFWHPKVIGQVNDQYLKVARIHGEFVWHSHENEDELFWVLGGEMTMDFEDRSVTISEGQFLVVPKGTMHRPSANEECLILLIETVTTQHTGDTITEMTVAVSDQL